MFYRYIYFKADQALEPQILSAWRAFASQDRITRLIHESLDADGFRSAKPVADETKATETLPRSASGRPDLPGHEHLPRDGHLPRHELQQRVPADRAFITWMDALCDFPSLNALDRYQALMDPHWTMQLRNFAPKLERHIETFRRCV
ncbi:MAG: hypothetical protein EBX64_02140 [Betaproteobacteria bacterium]|nr:hypothetical protein [Betaproteobacteria bacterium]